MSTRRRSRTARRVRVAFRRGLWRSLPDWLPTDLARWLRVGGIGLVAALFVACAPASEAQLTPRSTLFIGIDVSASFQNDGRYDDAMEFASHYIYGHLNGMGELDQPRALFVGAIGGERPGQPQAFHPVHDFEDKIPEEIEADLRDWFAPDDQFTDFNAFFQRAATLVKRQNLALAPITLVLLTDGVPDLGQEGQDGDERQRYTRIDLDPLEYLARNVTVRILYPDPAVAVHWERDVARDRVRMWTVDAVVMRGWREQLREPEPVQETVPRVTVAPSRTRDPRIGGPSPVDERHPEPAHETNPEPAEPGSDEPATPEAPPAGESAVAATDVADSAGAPEAGAVAESETAAEAEAAPETQAAPEAATTHPPEDDAGVTSRYAPDPYQLAADREPMAQPDLWRWIKDNVDFRVRRTVL